MPAAGSTLYAAGDIGNIGNISGSQNMTVQSTDAGATWSIAYQGTATGSNLLLTGNASSATRIVTLGGVRSVTLP